MFVSAHILTGAALGGLLPPPAAFAAGLGSHVAMDRLPHWGDPDPDRFLAVARVDGLTGLALIGLVVLSSRHRRSVLAGVAGAVLLDVDKPSRHFLGVSPFPAVIDRWHLRIQQGREWPRHLRRDVALTAVAAPVTILLLRRRG